MKKHVNGIEIHCELTGEPEKPVVMLSHSLSTDMAMWDFQIDALRDRYRVLRYDTRGHGKSDAPAVPYTMQQLVDDAMQLLDALDIEQAYFAGLSMGGMVGQGLALDAGHRLKGLVLSSTTAVMSEETQPIWQERIDNARRKGMQSLAPATLERWFTPAFLESAPPEVEKIRRLILGTPVDGFVGCSEAIRHLDYLNRLSAIEVPTLIMVGEGDPGTPVAAAEAIHRRIDASRLEIIPDAYHLCNIEQKEMFNRILRRFLDELEDKQSGI